MAIAHTVVIGHIAKVDTVTANPDVIRHVADTNSNHTMDAIERLQADRNPVAHNLLKRHRQEAADRIILGIPKVTTVHSLQVIAHNLKLILGHIRPDCIMLEDGLVAIRIITVDEHHIVIEDILLRVDRLLGQDSHLMRGNRLKLAVGPFPLGVDQYVVAKKQALVASLGVER